MKLMRSMMTLAVPVLVAGCVSFTGEEWAQIKAWGFPVQAGPRAQAYAHHITAMIYERRDEQAKANLELQAAAKLDPEAVTPTLRLIRGYVRQQDYQNASSMCSRALLQRPKNANLWIVQGQIYQQLKRYDEAEAALKKAIEIDPDNAMGYSALVEHLESTNDLVATIDLYHRLIEMNPEAAGFYYQLGLNLARIKDTEGARAALSRAIKLSPNLIQARYMLGVMCLDGGDNQECVAQLQLYLRERPGDNAAQESLAGALTRLGRYPEALSCLTTILGSDQVKPQHFIETMYVSLLAGRPGDAERKTPPDGAPFFATLFTALARQAKGEPFLPLLESLDTIEGDLDRECNDDLNGLIYLFGKEETGKWLLEKWTALRKESNSRTLAIVHGRTLVSLERYTEAVDVLQPLIKGDSSDRWVHYYLSMCFEKLKRAEDTESNLTAFLKYSPDDPDGLNFLGYFYADQGIKLDKAEELIKKALAVTPESPFYLDSLGWVYYKRGKADEAIDHIQRAIYRMDSDDAVLRDHLGDAYLLKGDPVRAVTEWEHARRLDPKLEGVQKKIEEHKKAAPGKK